MSVSSKFSNKQKPQNLIDGNAKTYWAAAEGSKNASVELDFGKNQLINFVELQEYIALGQRVKSFSLEIWDGNNWKEVATETTIGYKRIIKIKETQTQKIRIKINDSKAEVILGEIRVW